MQQLRPLYDKQSYLRQTHFHKSQRSLTRSVKVLLRFERILETRISLYALIFGKNWSFFPEEKGFQQFFCLRAFTTMCTGQGTFQFFFSKSRKKGFLFQRISQIEATPNSQHCKFLYFEGHTSEKHILIDESCLYCCKTTKYKHHHHHHRFLLNFYIHKVIVFNLWTTTLRFL